MKSSLLCLTLLIILSCAGQQQTVQQNIPEKDTSSVPVSNIHTAETGVLSTDSTSSTSAIPTVPVNTVDKPPRLISGTPPSYSYDMIKNNVEGQVKALILVGRAGSVKDVSILEHLGFGTDEATKTALFKYMFEPAVKDGKPVAVWIEMSVNFRPVRKPLE